MEGLSSFASASTKNRLLSKKDAACEDLVLEIAREVITSGIFDPCVGDGADDKQQAQISQATKKLAELSPVLSFRLGGILKSYMSHLQDLELEEAFADIEIEQLPLKEKSEIYGRCFDTLIDSRDCVSIATPNEAQLGNITPKDYFLFCLFAFCSCRRVKGDDLLQLVVSGNQTNKRRTFVSDNLFDNFNLILV